MNDTAKKPRLQADSAYEHAHLVAGDLLEHISELLQDMPAPDVAEHPINWGHVGDINEVNRRLQRVIDLLSDYPG